jgi:hypothetical protein
MQNPVASRVTVNNAKRLKKIILCFFTQKLSDVEAPESISS